MSACCAALSLIFARRFAAALPFGFLVCGLTLMVAMLGEANPQITLLMPVLQSPLLSIHVAVIMVAYSLLSFTLFNGLTALLLHALSKRDSTEKLEHLQTVSHLLLYPAVFLLATGIFIGAVWANVSWGRYWGWDPKEVWALITLLVYASALHTSSLPLLRRPVVFHTFCVAAFLTVLVTYFGVNFLLGGMHSYGVD
ncbi:MAG: cytochrome c biogenesis protein CcsA [Clostridium sp.]|nr:cytochrome c biogenesis protein CcsA [Clostridium sp.]